MRDPTDHCQEIVSRIYLGSSDAFTKENITEKKITHVLSLGDFSNDLDLNVEYKVRSAVISPFFFFLFFCLLILLIQNINIMDVDGQNIIQYFDETNEFIQQTYKTGGRILVHCQAGVSRSATILAACLMRSKKIKRDEAIEIIKRKRSCVAPNDGFMEQLNLYYDLDFDVDTSHVEYRRFLVASMAEEQKSNYQILHYFSTRYLICLRYRLWIH